MDDITSTVDATSVGAALASLELFFTSDYRGDAHLTFAPGRVGAPDLFIRVSADDGVLVVRGRAATTYSADRAPEALSLINDFHTRRRWPTGRVEWAEGETPAFRVVGEVHVPVREGATAPQVLHWLQLAMSSIGDMAEKVHDALTRGTPTTSPCGIDLETWLND